MTGATDLRDNQWHHVAVVRTGTAYLGFVDGAQEFSNNITGAMSNPAVALAIGTNSNGGEIGFNGQIDEVRLSKGIARWTTTFTPPNAPY
jgi:hypothetical protein